MKNFYQWLKITPDATPEQVAAASQQRIDALRQMSPEDEPKTEKLAVNIKAAGLVLMDAKSKARYDELLESVGVEAANKEMLDEQLARLRTRKPSSGHLPAESERAPNLAIAPDDSKESSRTSVNDIESTLPTIAGVDPRTTPLNPKKKSGGLSRVMLLMASIITAGLSAVCVAAVVLWSVWEIDPFGLFAKTTPAVTVVANNGASSDPNLLSNLKNSNRTGPLSADKTQKSNGSTTQKNPVLKKNDPAVNPSNPPKKLDAPKSELTNPSREPRSMENPNGNLIDKLNGLPENEEPDEKTGAAKSDSKLSVSQKYLAPAPERSAEETKAIAKRNEQLLAELEMRSTLLPLQIDLPIQPIPGDSVAHQTYVEEVLRAKLERRREIRDLNDATSKTLDELSKELWAKEDAHAAVQQVISLVKRLSGDDLVTMDSAGSVDSELKAAIKTYSTAAGKIDAEFEKESRIAADRYLRDFDELIRKQAKTTTDPKSMEKVLQFRELMKVRQADSLQGNFVLITNGDSFPKLYCGGKLIQFGNNGVSKLTRLDLRSDIVAVDVEAIEPGTKLFLSFVTKDLNHQLIIGSNDVHLMHGDVHLRSLNRQSVEKSKLVSEKVEPDPDGKKLTELLQLPTDQGDWFTWKEAVKILAIKTSHATLASRHGPLTRKTQLQLPDLAGLDVLDLPADKHVLILHLDFEGKPLVIGEEFQKYGLKFEVDQGFKPKRLKYSQFHTIVLSENFLRAFEGRPLEDTQPLLEFMEQGGHLFVLGTFNGESGKTFLKQFGIETGFFHNHSFEPNGLPTALFLWGNELLVPADRALVSTGNFSCSSSHTLILKRGQGNTVLDLKMMSKKIGKGRFTYSNIQPEVGEGRWFRTAMASWISRGSPTTKE